MRSIRPYHAILACLLALLPVSAGSARADEIGGTAQSSQTHSASRAVGGGLLSGTLGFTAGFVIGMSMEGSSSNEYAGVEYGFVVGSVVGGIMLPLGVHGGNRSRGNGWLVMGTSVAVAATGWAATSATGNAFLLPVTALGQLVACTAVEMATTPDAEPTPTVGLSFAPTLIDRKPGFVIAGRF